MSKTIHAVHYNGTDTTLEFSDSNGGPDTIKRQHQPTADLMSALQAFLPTLANLHGWPGPNKLWVDTTEAHKALLRQTRGVSGVKWNGAESAQITVSGWVLLPDGAKIGVSSGRLTVEEQAGLAELCERVKREFEAYFFAGKIANPELPMGDGE